ncbi:MAG: hypothetical protein RIS17_1872 [Pseudomonadota bacterium]|jgi:hypothetical protein
MSDPLSTACTAFADQTIIARGALIDVALAIKAADGVEQVLVFDDASGRVIDLDLSGSTADIVARLGVPAETRGRGRPKLGVIAREVTLLPRHWDWLAQQSGGASPTLRRLIDAARKADAGQAEAKAQRETAYRFMAALAGDLPGYEEAIRALFAGDTDAMAASMADWPADIRVHALHLAGCKDSPQ